MSRRLSARFCLGIATAAFGCNAMTGVDQLERNDNLDDQHPIVGGDDASVYAADAHTGDARARIPDDGGASEGASPLFDAGGADAGTTFCDFTTLWRFDGKTESSQGDNPVNNPSLGYGGGKYGQAIQIPNTSHLEYSGQRSGKAIVLPNQGTVSMWIKAGWSYPCDGVHTFFALDSDSLYMDCEKPGALGLWLDLPNMTYVGASVSGLNGAWTTDYNHMVATWSQTPPQMTVVLNANMANTTTTAWTPPHPNVNIFYLSFPTEPAQAALDDVAIWTRAVSNAEIGAIHGAGKSIGDVCGLP
jgi:hypothetical protein